MYEILLCLFPSLSAFFSHVFAVYSAIYITLLSSKEWLFKIKLKFSIFSNFWALNINSKLMVEPNLKH